MILDLSTRFSNGQAVTADAISTNVLDLRNGSAPVLADEGILGADLWLVVRVGTAFATATSITFTLESDSTADLATSATVHYTQTVLLAALTANTVVVRTKLPSGNYERYLGMRYTVNGADATAGTLDAFLTPAIDRNLNYPSGFDI